MPSPYIITTATDDGYAELAIDMVRSLRDAPLPFSFDIGILDLGLSDASKVLFNTYDVIFRKPGVDIEYPGRVAWEKKSPFYRGMTARPFLRDYFPGYQSYMWMDADTWLQTPEAPTIMLPSAAREDALHIVAEFDRDYSVFFKNISIWKLYSNWYKANFSDALAQEMLFRPMFNSGVFALSPSSIVWDKWARIFTDVLAHAGELDAKNFMADQLSLNVALYQENCPYRVMPTEFNWISLYCMPLYDEEQRAYVRPTLPRTRPSVIHIAGKGKLQQTDIMTTTGQILKRRLTYSAFSENENTEKSGAEARFAGDRL